MKNGLHGSCWCQAGEARGAASTSSLLMESEKRKEAQRSAIEPETVEVSGSSCSGEDEATNANDDNVLLSTPSTCKSIRLSNIISPELVSHWIELKLATEMQPVLVSTAQSLRHNPSEIALNKESIRQARRCYRGGHSHRNRNLFFTWHPSDSTLGWEHATSTVVKGDCYQMGLVRHRQLLFWQQLGSGTWPSMFISCHLIQLPATQDSRLVHVFCWRRRLRQIVWVWTAGTTCTNW